MPELRHIVVNDPKIFLRSIAKLLSDGARISIEGDLTQCDFSFCKDISFEETGNFKRNTISPIQDFFILSLESKIVEEIISKVIVTNQDSDSLYHILIEKNGEIQFAAYDSFHPKCVVCGPLISDEFLNEQKVLKVVQEL